jgi:hypothetical protein
MNENKIPFTVDLKARYFVSAIDEDEALDTAGLAALGQIKEIAENGEIDITDAVVVLGHELTVHDIYQNSEENGDDSE